MLKNEIILLMKDFKEVSKSSKKKVSLKFNEIPIEPHLMGYLFKNILGFDVQYRIFEKINYYIFFTYKGYEGCVSHRKLCYELEIESEVKDEVVKIFSEAKKLLEKYFLELSANSIKNDNYVLDNMIYTYKQRICFYTAQIKKSYKVLKDMENKKRPSFKKQEFVENDKYCTKRVHFIDLSQKYKKALLYNIESYVDSIFSLLEHLLTLVSVFTNYNSKYKTFLQVIKSGWISKWTLVFGNTPKSNRLKEELEYLKDLYRNRLSHGMFSKELKVSVNIENFGYYPLFVGDKLRGFSDSKNIVLDYNKFLEVQKLYKSILRYFKTRYKCEMIIIESGIPIYLDKTQYTKALLSSKDAQDYVDYISYIQDNQYNMDW